MNPTGFVFSVVVVFSAFYTWAVKNLPKEEWQFIGSMPLRKLPDGEWVGVNFTFYGFFVASALALGGIAFVIFSGAAGLDEPKLVLFTLAVFGIGLTSSRLVASIIEKQGGSFSVAGATFVVALTTPILLWVIGLPVLTTAAALCIAYCFGEALGRFACLSFGCCYGKPVSALHPTLNRCLCGRTAVFRGPLKKAVYEGRSEGSELIPVQALSSAVCFLAGIAAMWLFLEGYVRSALIVSGVSSQGWRAIAETLRADFRGAASWSRYQIMACFLSVYVFLLAFSLPLTLPEGGINLSEGFTRLWKPGYGFLFQTLWFVSFIYYGKSTVTGSKIELTIRERG